MKTQNLHKQCYDYLGKVHNYMTPKDNRQYNYCFQFLNVPTPLSIEDQFRMERFFEEE